MGAMDTTKRKRGSHSALVKEPCRVKGGERSVALRVSIIGCRSRVLDSDNFAAGCKPLRDAIARHFGLDDADDCIAWEYGQVRTDGEQGVIVKIERL